MKTLIKSFLLLVFLTVQILPQEFLERQFKGYTSPDELVSLSPNVSFNDAVALLNRVSESVTGKRIVSTYESVEPIGIEITNMAYDKALVILVQYTNLVYEEKEDVIIIKRRNEKSIDIKPETYAAVDSREVKISAIFFEMDVTESRKRGIDWKVIFAKEGMDVGSELITNEFESDQGALSDYKIAGAYDFNAGEFFGEATALFKFFEDENLGEVIASPTVVVRDRNKGRIQVGSDVSVKQRDFAGNVIETFFPTGTIIEVTPFVYREDEVDYILLKILVERSSFIQGELTTEIKKTNTSTEVVMLNGEETVLGGLFINQDTKIRTGIPFLKDLPEWFFGLRYLFGSDESILVKKELVILLKTELLPTLKERVVSTQSDNLLQEEIIKNNKKLKNVKPKRNNQ